jgi:hypothetical protein
MTLPALHNVCAAFEPDPRRRRNLQQQLLASGWFRAVQCTSRGWLLAVDPVGGESPCPSIHESVFCEHTQPAAGSELELLRASELAPDTLSRFPGDFTFVHLLHDGSIVLVRSCAGRVPLYYTTGAQRVLVGSRLDYLVAFAERPVRIDGLATALALSGYATLPDRRTPIAGAYCLPPAHHVRLGGTQSDTPMRYWTPRRALQRPTATRQAEHAERLHDLLLTTLSRELSAEDGNLLWCSGGVDSSALAALIAGELRLPLWTQSYVSPDPAIARYEYSYLLALQERYRFSKSWRDINTPAHCLQLAQNSPQVSYPICYFPLSGLDEVARRAPIKVAIGGEFADEGTGSHRNIGDWLDHTTPRDLLNPRSLPNGHHTVRQWLTWRTKRPFRAQWQRLPDRLSAMFRPAIREEYEEYARRQRARFALDREPLRSLWFRVSQDAWRAEWWEATTVLGIRPLAPFYTRELLELYFDCHPLEWFDGQRPKALLRRAMTGCMPEWHRERPDKGSWPDFLDGARLPASRPPLTGASNDSARELLDCAWLDATFSSEGKTSQASALDALQLSWLANMLNAIERSTRASAASPRFETPATHPISDVRPHFETQRDAARSGAL